MISSDDWRRQGQERYLKGKSLTWKKYTVYSDFWKHDHCSFCGEKFMKIEGPDFLTEGYVTDDNHYWICKVCYKDFCEEFEWSVN